ncbi:MAG: tRNA lysidine(34) synthetase TilS [Candidatus Reconcilbacillus cellulovorans]|uniref:tRNA(Ile)-lysidine synthase n=1 Tax=Candidatus Reconcilbacillus cellulovorans TaxID=1906605 RepID=A0A2A6E223_9BACL|nr:MAG: tRNA lysidine(34) synthetase TilS [Candidatus Reconcilbacillus cellulovorans]
MSRELERAIERAVRAGLLARGDRLVVAFSGGPDSTALLHLLHRYSARWDWRLVAAHVNHGLRAGEAERDAEAARAFAERLGVPFERGDLDVPAVVARTKENVQAAARRLRYAFLREVAARHGASKIALAHHADDQAETVLLRLVRGAGPSGLAGIPERRREGDVEVVRPLLGVTKADILEYCEAHGLLFCRDSGNETRRYDRNRIRLDVMPVLRELNPAVSAAISRLAGIVREEDAYLDEAARCAATEGVRMETGEASFSRAWFCGLPLALQRRVIKLILNYLSEQEKAQGWTDWTWAHAEAVREAVVKPSPPNADFAVRRDVRLRRQYDEIRLFLDVSGGGRDGPLQVTARAVSIDVSADGELRWFGAVLVWNRIPASELARRSLDARREAAFDADALVCPVAVRSWRPGDRMQVLGMEGTKKVQDLFVDDKVPVCRRRLLPVVTDGVGDILWIPGVRRSRLALVTETTERVLYMKYCDQDCD